MKLYPQCSQRKYFYFLHIFLFFPFLTFVRCFCNSSSFFFFLSFFIHSLLQRLYGTMVDGGWKENFFADLSTVTTQNVRVIFQGPMTREVITVISPNPGRDMGFSVWKFSPPPDLLCQEVTRDWLTKETSFFSRSSTFIRDRITVEFSPSIPPPLMIGKKYSRFVFTLIRIL